MNKETRRWQWISHITLASISIICIIPFLLLVISSVTDEMAILKNGYSFLPESLSNQAYQYLWEQRGQLFRAYGITILVTVVGTSIGLALTALLAYPLSRKDMPLGRIITFMVFFTLLFNGGLVPTYYVYTQIFDIKNTIWALIVPVLLVNGFNVLLMRTFFMNTIPDAVLESARIDGASEFRAFFSIVLPMSLPILATIGLLQTIMYWNDWMNGLIYLTDPSLYSIQNILNRILSDIQFLTSNSDYAAQSGEAISQLPSATIRMAIAVVGILPIIVAYPLFQKYLVKGIAIGSVK
ncbi:carbohydrate ABC transporter permease [Bacillus sp. MRMR6]|uniref:carbohydrate ABC transporter permease n=1 Tax=Bacillus sp. MRMR6 TaxID=1928617 RepID=UPI000951FD22|nr:carbohydrate ABC transporter permease [Bacillus sp. MRMR6]OLS37272.1 sugar ABC transporter permease [Bacillus sp. MRMR6]